MGGTVLGAVSVGYLSAVLQAILVGYKLADIVL